MPRDQLLNALIVPSEAGASLDCELRSCTQKVSRKSVRMRSVEDRADS